MTTVAAAADGHALAEELVESGLAGCVQVLPGMASFYRWKGKLQKEQEHLLLIKILAKDYDALEAFLQSNHPYDVPEIVALEASRVAQAYLHFITNASAGD